MRLWENGQNSVLNFMKCQKNSDVPKTKYRVGILTAPTEKASVGPISNLVTIFKSISRSVVIITGNAAYDYFKNNPSVTCYDNSHPMEKNQGKKVLYYFLAQLISSVFIIKTRNEVDLWFLFMGGEREFVPIVTAKLLKKPTLLILPGSIVKSARYAKDPFVWPIRVLSWITRNLVTGLIIYSPHFRIETDSQQYEQKILYAHEHFLNFEKFLLQAPLETRSCLIGFFGRFSGEKGVSNFVRALPEVLNKQEKVRVIIGGDGPLRGEIETYIDSNGLNERVKFAGWINHDDLPEYLNRLQLLIIPSYTEGIPNVMLEAMACGTPVLATPVGVIPDVIKDGETGFIMEDNSPKCIAENIIRALSSPDIKHISTRGQKFAMANYSFEKTVEDWENILQKVW